MQAYMTGTNNLVGTVELLAAPGAITHTATLASIAAKLGTPPLCRATVGKGKGEAVKIWLFLAPVPKPAQAAKPAAPKPAQVPARKVTAAAPRIAVPTTPVAIAPADVPRSGENAPTASKKLLKTPQDKALCTRLQHMGYTARQAAAIVLSAPSR